MIYCYQRPCSINLAYGFPLPCVSPATGNTYPLSFLMSLPYNFFSLFLCLCLSDSSTVHICLTPHMRLARCPRFSLGNINEDGAPSEPILVCLGSRSGFDTHNSSSELVLLEWGRLLRSYPDILTTSPMEQSLLTEAILTCSRLLIAQDTIAETYSPLSVSSREQVLVGGFPFPGLYCASLPARPFLSPDWICLETQWRTVNAILVIHLPTANIHVCTYDTIGEQLNISIPFRHLQCDAVLPAPLSDTSPSSSSSSWLSPCLYSLSIVNIHPAGGIVLLSSSPVTPPFLLYAATQNVIAAATSSAEAAPSNPLSYPVPTCHSNELPTIHIATIKPPTSTSHSSVVRSRPGPMTCHVLHTPVPDSAGALTLVMDSILILPPVDQRADGEGEGESKQPVESLPPLLVCPHGGPHSAFTTAYVAQYSHFLCSHGGYALLLINYRGSTVIRLILYYYT
jgi:hypothetical protein